MNYSKRISNLQAKLPSFSADALLIEHPTDLLYLTGQELSTGKLFIAANSADLIVDGRYFEICSKSSPCPVLPLEKVSIKKWLEENPKVKKLAFDSTHTPYSAYSQLKEYSTLVPVPAPVEHLRLIKDPDEIALLKAAAKLGCEGYQYISSRLSEKVTEAELAWELEKFWREKGAKKVAFDPIIAFGANGSMPHHRAGSTRLAPNSSVLIDIGVTLNNYHSDMTRVVYFGKANPKIAEIYAIVEEAKQRALKICEPGRKVKELDDAARGYITKKGYGDSFNHGLGHGIGLDVHEMPRLRNPGPYSEWVLEPGMVITIEPGIYLPGIGGVRLEDTVLLTEIGHENLTQMYL